MSYLFIVFSCGCSILLRSLTTFRMPDKRKCYLCKYNYDKNKRISLHHFPNQHQPNQRKQWLKVCGLNESDDVSHIFLCTRHFHPSDYDVQYNKIKLHLGVVPTIATLSPEIKIEKNVFPSTSNSQDSTSVNAIQSNNEIKYEIVGPHCSSNNIEFGVVSDHDYAMSFCEESNDNKENVEIITVANDIVIESTNTSSNFQCSNNVSDEELIPKKNVEMLTVANDIVIESNTSSNFQCSNNVSDEELIPKKNRRVFHPRYISEIQLSDFATLQKAKTTLNFIKATDAKTRKTIQQLKAINKKLTRKIDNMKHIMLHWQKMKSEDTRNA